MADISELEKNSAAARERVKAAEQAVAAAELEVKCEAAEQALLAARECVKPATERVKRARMAFATALRNFQNQSGAPADFAELHRRHIAAEQERKLALAEGRAKPVEGPASTAGRSRIDQIASHSAGSRPQRHPAAAGGPGFRRGGYPMSELGKTVKQ